jgi:transcriptional regulator with XRE-family HTH domain
MATRKNVVPGIKHGAELARLRRQRGLTQEQLAADLGCTYETISNYERDITPITPLISNYLRYYFTYGPFPPDSPRAPKDP